MKRTIAAMTIAVASLTATGFTAEVGLVPRVEIPKTPTALLELPDDFTGRALVKFKDAVGARPTGLGNAISASGMELETVDDILSRQRVALSTAFPGVSPSAIAEVQSRAALMSGKAQPDLLGMMYLTGTPEAVAAAALELNDLGLVEFVEYERMRYAGDGSTQPYPHHGNWKEMAELDERLHPGDTASGIKPWASGEGDEAYEPAMSGIIRDELARAGYERVVANTAAREDAKHRGHRHDTGTDGEFVDFALGGMDPECGEMTTGNCWAPAGNGSAFCDDAACCELVCEIDEFCCLETGGWDFLCAAQANILCGEHTPNDPNALADPPTGPDRCAAGIYNGGCFATSLVPGCNDAACCFAVCEIEEFCCTGIWDDNCVALAFETCIDTIDAGPTPDMTGGQGYLSVGNFPFPLPGDYPFDRLGLPTLPDSFFPGFTGSGFDLYRPGEAFSDFGVDGIDGTGDEGEGNGWFDGGEPWDDFGRDRVDGTMDAGEGDGIWNEPRGIQGIAERALLRDGIDLAGNGVQVRGKTMNVAIIDASIHRNHEEFAPLEVGGEVLDGRRVIVENVRLFLDETIALPSQGTAVASVLVARDETLYGQPASGVVGMAPEAQGYFYAITSRDEGPRELAAWFGAISQLDTGDVIVATYEVPGVAITMTESIGILAGVAVDAGIGVVVRAGDQCADLAANGTVDDETPDTGAIVVGGGSPGTLFVPGNGLRNFRLPGSNYTDSDEVLSAEDVRQVHMRGWGAFVVAAGYGDLYRIDPGDGTGIDPNRAYTAGFSSTAAAAAQLGGLYINTQGFHRQYFGFSLSPRFVRQLFGAPGTTNGTPPRLFGNFGLICGLDILPEQPWNHIGAWPELTGDGGVVNGLLTLGGIEYADAPFVQDVVLIRGDFIEGSVFSVRGNDGQFYQADAVRTEADQQPGNSGPSGQGGPVSEVRIPEMASADYLIGGNIVDLVAVGQTDITSPTQMDINVNTGPSELFTIVFVEVYNYSTGRWTLVGVGANPEAGSQLSFPVSSPSRHINETGGMLARVYYVGFPGFGSALTQTNYRARTDLIDIRVLGGIDT